MKTHIIKCFTISVILVLSISQSYSQEKLELEGAIIIKHSEDSMPAPGTIRFNPNSNDFEGWNGYFWASLTGFTLGSVTDIDSNVYRTVKIGTQVWMAENLRTSKYHDGTSIPNVTDSAEWSNADYGAWCWYDNDNSYEQPYGKLYNWYAVNDSKSLCPTGWDVPTDDEWITLTDFLGGLNVAGGPMKEVGSAHWISPNNGATNESGFTALPGGIGRNPFFNLTGGGYWWSNNPHLGSSSYSIYYIYSFESKVRVGFWNKSSAISVRCLKD